MGVVTCLLACRNTTGNSLEYKQKHTCTKEIESSQGNLTVTIPYRRTITRINLLCNANHMPAKPLIMIIRNLIGLQSVSITDNLVKHYQPVITVLNISFSHAG